MKNKFMAIAVIMTSLAAVGQSYQYLAPFGCDPKSDECTSQPVMHKIDVPVSPPMVFISNCAFGKCDPTLKHRTGADWARSDFKDYCQKRKADFGWQKCYVFSYTESEPGKPTKSFVIDGDGKIHLHGVSLRDALLIVASNALWSSHQAAALHDSAAATGKR